MDPTNFGKPLDGPVSSEAYSADSKLDLSVITDQVSRTVDKKRITSYALSQLVAHNFLSEKRVNVFGIDETCEYSGPVQVHKILQPNELVIKLNGSALTEESRTNLQIFLSSAWDTVYGFDVIVKFPGLRMHVIVASRGLSGPVGTTPNNADTEPAAQCQASTYAATTNVDETNDGVQLCYHIRDINISHGRSVRPSKGYNMRFHRGYITKIIPGSDVFSARYEIFLYDDGVLCQVNIGSIVPMPDKCRVFSHPEYRLLKIPGLKPIKVKEMTTELYSMKKTSIRFASDSWADGVYDYISSLLNTEHHITLDVLAVQGPEILGDLRIVTGSDAVQSYASNLVKKDWADHDSSSYYDELLLDAEDEEMNFWMLDARTWC